MRYYSFVFLLLLFAYSVSGNELHTSPPGTIRGCLNGVSTLAHTVGRNTEECHYGMEMPDCQWIHAHQKAICANVKDAKLETLNGPSCHLEMVKGECLFKERRSEVSKDTICCEIDILKLDWHGAQWPPAPKDETALEKELLEVENQHLVDHLKEATSHHDTQPYIPHENSASHHDTPAAHQYTPHENPDVHHDTHPYIPHENSAAHQNHDTHHETPAAHHETQNHDSHHENSDAHHETQNHDTHHETPDAHHENSAAHHETQNHDTHHETPAVHHENSAAHHETHPENSHATMDKPTVKHLVNGCANGVSSLTHTLGRNTDKCPDGMGVPSCAWIQAHSKPICETIDVSWDIINGPNCHLNGASYGCKYHEGKYATTDTFCCPIVEVELDEHALASTHVESHPAKVVHDVKTPHVYHSPPQKANVVRTAPPVLSREGYSVSTADVCEAHIDGITYDLSKLSGKLFESGSGGSGNYHYSLAFCATSPCGVNHTPHQPNSASFCQQTNTYHGKIISEWKDAIWSTLSPAIGKGIAVHFSNGDMCGGGRRSTVIQLICDPHGTGDLRSVSEPSHCSYEAKLYTPVVCDMGHNAPISGVAVILILLLVSFSVYICVGCYYKRVRLGVTSWSESIPNIEFWREFPSLVREGFRYTSQKVTGCFKKKENYQYERVNTNSIEMDEEI